MEEVAAVEASAVESVIMVVIMKIHGVEDVLVIDILVKLEPLEFHPSLAVLLVVVNQVLLVNMTFTLKPVTVDGLVGLSIVNYLILVVILVHGLMVGLVIRKVNLLFFIKKNSC